MEQILLQIKSNLPIIVTVLVAVLCLIIILAVFFLIRKKKNVPDINSDYVVDQTSVQPPQKAPHTLLTDDTLELEPVNGNTAFAVEYEITYVHSDEVI